MQAMAIGAEKMAEQAGTAAPQPRLVKAAHEFEAMMMQELLKPMTSRDGAGGDEDSGSAGALGEFASEALGRAMSTAGGFGIASEIIRSLSHSGNQHASGKVTGNLHQNAGIKTRE
jgi:Rod binding domain-containing protein